MLYQDSFIFTPTLTIMVQIEMDKEKHGKSVIMIIHFVKNKNDTFCQVIILSFCHLSFCHLSFCLFVNFLLVSKFYNRDVMNEKKRSLT